MEVRESMSRVLITCAAVAFTWSCNSGTTSKDEPGNSPGGGSGDNPSAAAGGGATPAPETKKPEAPPAPETKKPDEKKVEPRFVTVQHILIGYRGSVRGKNITRTKEEAATLAADILKRAKAGEDFDKLVREYTDDSPPGIYKMSNRGVPAPPGGYSRDGMVAAFGDVGFPLEVGGIGMAVYDPRKSPYGWHIIKRVE